MLIQYKKQIIYGQQFYQLYQMWNLISANKITEQRIRNKSMQTHKKSLKQMKPTFTVKEPEKPDFVYAKHKLQMSRRDRLVQIDRQNFILFNKMTCLKIADYKQNKLRPESQHLKTLNQHIMVQQAQDIYQQNKRICKLLMTTKTAYPTFKIIAEVQNLEKLNNKSKVMRAQSARNLSARPRSGFTSVSSKFYKSRVSKFDKQGNHSQEKINIRYKLTQPDSRPNSASDIKKKSSSRQYLSQNAPQKYQFQQHEKNLSDIDQQKPYHQQQI